MRAPNSGERKLTEPDFIRLKKLTAPGAFPQLADSLNEADSVCGSVTHRLLSWGSGDDKPVPMRLAGRRVS